MDVSSLQGQSIRDTTAKPVLQYEELPDYLTIKELQAYTSQNAELMRIYQKGLLSDDECYTVGCYDLCETRHK